MIYRIEHEISLESRTQMLAPNLDFSENPTMIHRTVSANHPTHVSQIPTKSSDKVSVEIQKNTVWKIALFLIGTAILSALGYGVYRWFGAKSDLAANAFDKIQILQLGSDGKSRLAVISPDGKCAAYASGDLGNRSLVVRQISTNSLITIVPPTSLDFQSISFSPAGDYIYYTQIRKDFSVNTLYQIPTLGGTPKKLIEDVDSAATFSPDGKRFAFKRNISNDNSRTIFIADAIGSNMQPLLNTKETDFTSPVWSPDGNKLLVGLFKNQNFDNFMFAEISIIDGSIKDIGSKKWKAIDSYGWLKDGSGFLIAGQEVDGGFTQIWRMSYPGGEVQAITNDTNNYFNLSVSADSKTIAVIKGHSSQGLWSFNPASKEMTQLAQEQRNLFWDTRLSQMPDGKLVFSRREGKEINFWTMNADGTNESLLLTNTEAVSNPVTTPDGRFIVFSKIISGNSQIWRVNSDGTNPIPLTEADANQKYSDPIITPDGETVIFNKNEAGLDKNSIAKVSIDGGKIEQVLDESDFSFMNPRISPDGKHLAVTSFDRKSFERHLVIASLEGYTVKQIEKKLEYSLIESYLWSPDGKSLTYLSRDGVPNLWKLPLDGGKAEPITDFKTVRIFNFTWARDGKTIFIVRGIVNNDLILIKNAAVNSSE